MTSIDMILRPREQVSVVGFLGVSDPMANQCLPRAPTNLSGQKKNLLAIASNRARPNPKDNCLSFHPGYQHIPVKIIMFVTTMVENGEGIG